MTKYFFVRHGESTANINKVSAGWTDVPLTDNGRQQAIELANYIKKSGQVFDVILSSPLSRALDTAHIIADTIGYRKSKIIIIEELKEKCAGNLELGPIENVYNKTEEEFIKCGGESAEMFRVRVKRVLKEIMSITEDMNSVLIVAHSGIYKMAKVIADKKENATALYEVEIPKNASLLEYPIQDSKILSI